MEEIVHKFPLVTVITVVYNGIDDIVNTIFSVLDQSYGNIEFIIVDGGSNDGTVDAINKYKDKIDLFISESDKGIYDAMNKGILHSRGEWINFMNCGDFFTDNDVLALIFSNEISENIKFIYSDYYIRKKNRTVKYKASYAEGQILHQSCIYRKSLHSTYGLYHVSNPILVSDYLFFNLIPKEYYFKTDVIISINDGNGISSGSWIIPQKYCIDYLFHRINLFQLFYLIVIGLVKNVILSINSKFFNLK